MTSPETETATSPAVLTMELGDVEITRVVEWSAPIAPVDALFPGSTPQMWERNRDWLSPTYWDAASNFYRACVQTWVLRSEGRTILVDTGLGDDKYRPYMPPWSHLRTGFLARLEAAGVRPGDVDVVVNTHVHADHVGWNTRLVDGAWVPTFENAEHVVARADVEYWNPLNGHPKHGSLGGVGAALGNQNMFEDSIAPVVRHARTVLWEDGHRIDRNLSLEPAPGHTPGSSVLVLESGADRALFVGDLVHTPLQVLEPHVEPCLSEDVAAAVRQRGRFLERAADTNALVLPAHLTGPGGLEVRREGSAFAVSGWAPFAPVG